MWGDWRRDECPRPRPESGAMRRAAKSHEENIRINWVHPGYADTPLTVKRFSNPAIRQVLIDRTPMGRLGTADDITTGVLILASDESTWVTGSELVIDGGMTA